MFTGILLLDVVVEIYGDWRDYSSLVKRPDSSDDVASVTVRVVSVKLNWVAADCYSSDPVFSPGFVHFKES